MHLGKSNALKTFKIKLQLRPNKQIIEKETNLIRTHISFHFLTLTDCVLSS